MDAQADVARPGCRPGPVAQSSPVVLVRSPGTAAAWSGSVDAFIGGRTAPVHPPMRPGSGHRCTRPGTVDVTDRGAPRRGLGVETDDPVDAQPVRTLEVADRALRDRAEVLVDGQLAVEGPQPGATARSRPRRRPGAAAGRPCRARHGPRRRRPGSDRSATWRTVPSGLPPRSRGSPPLRSPRRPPGRSAPSSPSPHHLGHAPIPRGSRHGTVTGPSPDAPQRGRSVDPRGRSRKRIRGPIAPRSASHEDPHGPSSGHDGLCRADPARRCSSRAVTPGRAGQAPDGLR
jgi:hypothetical protein